MNQKSNGGAAFPQHGWSRDPEAIKYMQDKGGMTLRDYFAAHAPAAPDDFGWAPGECDSWERSSRWAYVYADAMLIARGTDLPAADPVRHQLMAAVRGSHQAIDRLLARVIELDPTFMPSQSDIWSALKANGEALAAAGDA